MRYIPHIVTVPLRAVQNRCGTYRRHRPEHAVSTDGTAQNSEVRYILHTDKVHMPITKNNTTRKQNRCSALNQEKCILQIIYVVQCAYGISGDLCALVFRF